jgi:hypothetical protein
MHCELVVPHLFGAPGEGNAPMRFPALELLLARGRHRAAPAQRLEGWLQEAFDLGAGPLPAGALTLIANGVDPGTESWARADPVHLRVMRDHVTLVPGEAFDIPRAEADALCSALNGHFPGRDFTACEPARWCARFAPAMSAPALDTTAPPEPPKAAAPFVNEAQMVLHAHPVNEAREARGEPAVNSLWIWGGGAAPRAARSVWQSVSADDPAIRGAARLAGTRQRALPRSASEWLERLPEDGRQLAVLDAARTPLDELERSWFAPLLAALRAGRVGMVTIHVPDDAETVSFETIRADLRRLWRRAKPIKNYA